MEVTVRKLAGKLVAEIPGEALEALGVSEGDTLTINPGRLSELRVHKAGDADMLEIVKRIIDEDHEVLSRLAKSERMDMVADIMDEYDEALAELAK